MGRYTHVYRVIRIPRFAVEGGLRREEKGAGRGGMQFLWTVSHILTTRIPIRAGTWSGADFAQADHGSCARHQRMLTKAIKSKGNGAHAIHYRLRAKGQAVILHCPAWRLTILSWGHH